MSTAKINNININFPGSYYHTLNAIVLALKHEQNLLIKNPYPQIDSNLYNAYLADLHAVLEYVPDGLQVKFGVEDNLAYHPADSQRFDVDDSLAIYLACKCGDKIRFRKEDNEDNKRRVLILRRLGFKFFTPAANDEKVYDYDCVTSFKANKLKYNFLLSNYHLAGYLYKVAAICDCKVEVLAKFDIAELGFQTVYPFKLEFENLIKNSEEEDELQKRLAKLNKNKKKDPFHYKVSNIDADCPQEITLPSDSLLTAYAAVMALHDCDNEVKIMNLHKKSEAEAFGAILSKLNANCGFQKIGGSDSMNNYCLTVRHSELTAKKVDETKLRICRQAFAPLALAASLTPGKTILRGLPESSSLWRDRIGAIAELLTSANVRVGEIEDGIVIESPAEYGDIKYRQYDDPYLQLFQFCAALKFNTRPLTTEYFDFNQHFPDFHDQLKKIRSNVKMIAT